MPLNFQECTLSELELFESQPLQTSITSYDAVFYQPITSLDNSNVIEFFIPAASDHYRDLSSATLNLRVQLLKADGSTYTSSTAEEKKVVQPGFINNALHSIFKTCAVYMNNKLVSFIDGLSYKDYIDKILSFDDSCIKTTLINEGFIRDTTGPSFDKLDDTNTGLKERKTYVANSAIHDLVGKLNIDVFNIQKLLISGVDLKIVLTLESPKFFLMEGKDLNSTMKIHEASLKINQFAINPSVMLYHRQLLNKHNARYPFKKTEIKSFTVSSGVTSVNLDNVFTGTLPTNIVFGVVTNAAYTGSTEKNPFYFHHHNISTVGLYVNSKCVTGYPIETDFKTDVNLYARAYAQFMEGSGKLNTERANSITKSDFRRGFCLFPFILSSTQLLDSCSEVPQEGTVRLELKFNMASTETLSVICYAEFDAQLQIDKNLNVTVTM